MAHIHTDPVASTVDLSAVQVLSKWHIVYASLKNIFRPRLLWEWLH